MCSLLGLPLSAQIVIEEPVRFLALGDSYTIGESVENMSRWPAQLAKQLVSQNRAVDSVKVIARTGWRTDQLIEALNQEDPKNFNLVSLLIGVNNQYQGQSFDQMSLEFDCLLREAISRAGNKKEQVFVLSIPDYGFTPFGQSKDPAKITKELDEYNTYQREKTDEYGVVYIDITEISRNGLEDKSLVAEDGLHPSATQYRLWVNEIMKRIRME